MHQNREWRNMKRIVVSMMEAGMPRPKSSKREDPEYVEEILRRCPDLEDLRSWMGC